MERYGGEENLNKQSNKNVLSFLEKDSQCYTLNNKNVVLIHGFKHYVALLFHKGVLSEDKYHTLIQQTEKFKRQDN